MLLFCDSFDHYATADVGLKWTVPGPQGGLTIGAFGRNSTNGMHCQNDNGGPRKALPASVATLVAGVAFRPQQFGANTRVISFIDGSTEQIELWFNALQKLEVRRGATLLATSTTVLSLATYYYLEFKATIHPSAGAYEVRINNIAEAALTASGVNTRSSANSTADSVAVCVGQFTAQGTGWDFDDFYVCDTSGAQNNDFLGDIRVQYIAPTGAGATTQFTPSTGANWQNVDDAAPDGDTTYNSDATPGDIDTYAMSNLVSTAGSVKAVQTLISARKDDAGVRTIAPVVRHGGVDYPGTNVNIGNTYTFYREVMELNPGTGVAWTVADVNAAEFGVKEVA